MKKYLNVKNMVLISVMTAVICVLAPFSIPIGVVPITFANLAIYIALYVLGWKRGTICTLLYLLIGFIGVPVFSGFSSGPAKLFGPTGGYLIGYIPMAILAGLVIDRYANKYWLCFIAFVLATLVLYAMGTVWLSFQLDKTIIESLAIAVIPFIPGDLIKIFIAVIIGPQLRKTMKSANLI